jgi:hypothetical protein
MESKRNLNFEVKSSIELNAMLTGLIMDLRRGEVDFDTAKGIVLIADKINKNNVNAIEYKRLTKHENNLEFFDTKTNE